MPRLLKDLQINDVSSVDRGAGRGVKVMLMKRDDEPEAPTPDNVIDMTGLIGKKETDMSAEQIKKVIDDAVSAAMKDATDRITKAETENADLKDQITFMAMPVEKQEFCKNMSKDDKKKFAAKSKDDQDNDMDEAQKAAAVKIDPTIAKRLAEADEDRKILKALQLKDEQVTFEKRAVELGLPKDKGEVLRKAHHGDGESMRAVEEMIKSMNEALNAAQKDGQIFKEFGSQQQATGSTALDQLQAKARDLRKSEKGLSEQQAFAKVYGDPENAELVRMEKSERYKAAGVAA